MPRDADDVRTRLLRKLTLKREQERQRVLDREQLRLEHIKETRDKINALDKSIGKGTGVLRDIEKVSAQIRAQSFADGLWESCLRSTGPTAGRNGEKSSRMERECRPSSGRL